MAQTDPLASVVVKLGQDLTVEELELLNLWRSIAFPAVPSAQIPLDPRPGTENYCETFFLARTAEGRVVAFARFHNITMRIMDTTHPIFGLATVTAVEKGRGYGRVLVNAMRDHAVMMSQSAFGFAPPDVTPFYIRCGVGVMQGGSARFVYQGPARPGPKPGLYDVLYLQAGDGLVEAMMAHPDEKVRISRPIW